MAFWSDPRTQPKLSFKWFASFGVGDDIVRTYTLRSFQRPSFAITISEYIWLNDVNFKPGVLSWSPIEIIIADGEGREENNAKKLFNMLNGSGYQTINVGDPRSVIEKRKSSQALGGQLTLTQINSDSFPVEEWVLINPFMEAVNFGSNSYLNEELITISMTVRYDYAQYNSFT